MAAASVLLALSIVALLLSVAGATLAGWAFVLNRTRTEVLEGKIPENIDNLTVAQDLKVSGPVTVAGASETQSLAVGAGLQANNVGAVGAVTVNSVAFPERAVSLQQPSCAIQLRNSVQWTVDGGDSNHSLPLGALFNGGSMVVAAGDANLYTPTFSGRFNTGAFFVLDRGTWLIGLEITLQGLDAVFAGGPGAQVQVFLAAYDKVMHFWNPGIVGTALIGRDGTTDFGRTTFRVYQQVNLPTSNGAPTPASNRIGPVVFVVSPTRTPAGGTVIVAELKMMVSAM